MCCAVANLHFQASGKKLAPSQSSPDFFHCTESPSRRSPSRRRRLKNRRIFQEHREIPMYSVSSVNFFSYRNFNFDCSSLCSGFVVYGETDDLLSDHRCSSADKPSCIQVSIFSSFRLLEAVLSMQHVPYVLIVFVNHSRS